MHLFELECKPKVLFYVFFCVERTFFSHLRKNLKILSFHAL